MSLKYAVLATLIEGDASGYDLTKEFDASVANFWYASPPQLYRELEKLEADGLIAGYLVEQERRPNKRVFTLTEAGQNDLREFTAKSARPMVLRDDLLIKVKAVDMGHTDAVRSAIHERMEWARAKLARYEHKRELLLAGRTEGDYLREAERVGPYLTLLRGRLFEQDNIRWCEAVLAILAQRPAANDPPSAKLAR